MSEQAENTTNQEEFGIGSETTSQSLVNFIGGFTKSFLGEVKAHEIGKDKKFFVLDFRFKDTENIKTFVHREFIPTGKANQKQTEKENYDTNRERFNSRVKHIWEQFMEFPKEGLGKGSKSWDEVFTKIALAFNTSNNGNAIYIDIEGDKKNYKQVWLKCTYSKDNQIQFPIIPNFIERVKKGINETIDKIKTLQIDKKWDKVTQTDSSNSNNSPVDQSGVMGGPSTVNSTDTSMGF